MDKRKTTKKVVRILTDIGVGSASGSIVRNNIRRSQFVPLDIVLTLSAFVTGWAVAETVAGPVHATAERQVDALFDIFDANKTN